MKEEKRSGMRLTVIAFALVLAASSLAVGAEERSAFTVSFDTTLVKIFPGDVERAVSLPTTGTINLARNEHEALQVLVLAHADLQNVTVTAGDLVGEVTGATIPASSITVNAVGYVPVIEPFYKPYYVRVPGQAYWPDPLLPENSANASAGKVQPFWLSVYVPEDAPAGDYAGTVTVAAEGVASVEALLNVHVWNFTVPAESHLKTAFWLYPRYVRQYHGFGGPEDTSAHPMVIKYYENMLEHRMSYIEIGTDRPAPEVEIVEGREPDFSAWDAWMERWFARGQNFVAVPILRGEDRETVVAKSRAWGRHLKEKGWLDRTCVFLVDETTDGEEARAWVHEGDPDMRNALTWHPIPECPNVDIWIPQMERGYEKFPEAVRWARHENKSIWMYTSSPASGPRGTDFYPNTNIDFPGTHCRLLPWICWQEDLDGYLYWCVNHWDKNPWETAETFRNQNGNGSFYYPGADGPVGSIRLEAFRDGMEDYEYFYLLRNLADSRRSDMSRLQYVVEAYEVIDLYESARGFMYDMNRRPETLHSVRSHAAQLIERLSR